MLKEHFFFNSRPGTNSQGIWTFTVLCSCFCIHLIPITRSDKEKFLCVKFSLLIYPTFLHITKGVPRLFTAKGC